MYNWVEIKSEEDLPEDFSKEYLFYDCDGWFRVLPVEQVTDYYSYPEEDGSTFHSIDPYWVEFNLTHWAELIPPGGE